MLCMVSTTWNKWRWDGLGLGLAGLCVVHCLVTTIALALFSAAGSLIDPAIHEFGLMLAIGFGVLALGKGLWDHGFIMPACVGALGIGMMAGALTLPHGGTEILYTVLGVAVLALGHDLNHRAIN